MANPSGSTFRRVRRGLVYVALVLVGVVGFILWNRSANGEKQGDLGSTLLGGVVVGAALLAVQFRAERLEHRAEDAAAFASSSEPSAGRRDETADVNEPARRQPKGVPLTENFEVIYRTQSRDGSRIDARQAELLVEREGSYFQFVTAIAPGPSLRLLGVLQSTAPGKFWRAFSALAGPTIEDAVRRGELPYDDPTRAFEVFPIVEEAIKHAIHETEVVEGEVVYQFGGEGPRRSA